MKNCKETNRQKKQTDNISNAYKILDYATVRL